RHGNELVRGLLDGLAPRHLRVGLGDDRLREGEESRFHVLPGLRGTQEAGHAEGFLEIVQLLLSLPSRIGEVHLVPDDDEGDRVWFPPSSVAEEEDLPLDVVVDHRGAAPCRAHAYNACWLNVILANTGVPIEEIGGADGPSGRPSVMLISVS